MSAAQVAASLGRASRSGAWWRGRCPVCGSEALALRDGEYGVAIKCFRGCSAAAVRAELRRLGLVDDAAGAPPPLAPAEVTRQRKAEELNRRKRIANALDFWQHETSDPHGTAVERYWIARGLALPIPPTIRASLSWLRHPDGGTRPAMIALVKHVDFGPVAIHRTWLTPDGSMKASFRTPRLSLGPVGGGAVRLADAGETLLVGEGIETCASAMRVLGHPSWSALSTSGMVALVLPEVVRNVVILADNDINGAGETAAGTAAARWLSEGRRIRVIMPPVPDTDFNDVLLGRSHAPVQEVWT